MIDVFDLMDHIPKHRVVISCDRVPFHESDDIRELIDMINLHFDNIIVYDFNVEYGDFIFKNDVMKFKLDIKVKTDLYEVLIDKYYKYLYKYNIKKIEIDRAAAFVLRKINKR